MTRSPRRLQKQVKDTVSELPIHAARLAVMGVGRALLLTDRVRKDVREARESGLGPVLGRLRNDAGAITGMVVGKVSGNGKVEEETKSRAADSEISVGKPKPARPRPSTPPTRSPKPATPKPATKPVSKPTDKPVPRPDQTPMAKPDQKPAVAKAATPPKPAPKPSPKPAAKAEPKATPKPAPKATPKPAAKAEPKAAPKSKAKAGAGLPLENYDEATLASVRARLRNLDAKQVTELRDYERAHAARAEFLRMFENRIAKLRGEG
jgi:hypothetical protein